MKISSIIIAKNEAANITRCLQSQQTCIEEIIVLVDDTTTDNTIELCREFKNVKACTVKWMGYSLTKQHAVSIASNDWILWIDADEEISGELSAELNNFKQQEPGFAAYSVPRIANFLGRWIKHSGWYPGRVTRLFNRKSASFSSSGVHEHLEIKGSTGRLKHDLRHYTDPSIKHYFEKFNNYTTLAAEELNKKGKIFSLADLLIRPPFMFFKMYILKRGFLDGIQGFILAVFSSAYVFTKYSKFWELNNRGVQKDGPEQ